MFRQRRPSAGDRGRREIRMRQYQSAGQYQFPVCFCLAAYCAFCRGRYDRQTDHAAGIPAVCDDDAGNNALVWVNAVFDENLDKFEISSQKYKPTKYHVEGDWSSSSYLLALGAMAGEIEVNNLDMQSLQGDRMLLQYLREMGAHTVVGRNSINIVKSNLKAIKADLTDCIDLLPTMAVLAAAAEGTSVFTGIERARIKESDRVAAVAEGLARMGIRVETDTKRIKITGGKLKGALIDSKGDHRIAMAFSLLGTVVGDTVIDGAECVTKTWPEYWDVLQNLGVKAVLHG
jgi:3-phosphoshikimate 1-carboxyvinyltransferase